MQSEWRLQTEKLLSFTWLTVTALELQFARKSYVSVIALRFWVPENTENSRGVCSHVNIDDLRLFFELLLWNIYV